MLNHRSVHAFKVWLEIEQALRSAAECFLFLDFDGTLSPIVSNPHQAELAPRAQELLGGLQRMPGMRIALIRGRSLHDIHSRVGLDLTYAGNHGLEIGGPGIAFIEEHAIAMTGQIAAICADLSARLSAIPGALIEMKGLTASVHLRQIPTGRQAEAVAAVHRAVEPFSAMVQARAGKKILELVPRVNWDKGKAARKILQTAANSSAILPVCVGDDATDEDLFREFPQGINIRVGEHGNTAARFFLTGPQETLTLLDRIGSLWKNRF
jgi:trehalose-phosphatase